MSVEIERKFLVPGSGWKQGARGLRYRQGYLSADPGRSVRVRIAGDAAWLTIKGEATGYTRVEYEYPIPLADAERLLDTLCLRPLIEKTRYQLRYGGHQWDVDEFHGDNDGLVMAEIELASEQEDFARPPWLGMEVSDDPRYFNVSLARHPYKDW